MTYAEQQVRYGSDRFLEAKGWILDNTPSKNVFFERDLPQKYAKLLCNKRPDYTLFHEGNPIGIIEAKRPNTNLDDALQQARGYAQALKTPLIFATNGNFCKTQHFFEQKPLYLNGEEVKELLDVSEALKFITEKTSIVDTRPPEVIKSTKELIPIFSSLNNILRSEGLRAGIERFSEFANILFLKLVSEQKNMNYWQDIKNQSENHLINFINKTLLDEIANTYGGSVFEPLTIKNPKTLREIIERLDPLSLTSVNADIKGGAFEYFIEKTSSTQNDLGEYYTPRHIVKTMVHLADPQIGEKIYDPFCGTGGFLTSAFKYIKSTNRITPSSSNENTLKRDTLYGSEITSNARIAKMNMILYGDGHSGIEQKDSLAHPINEKYDVVLTNIPFSQKITPETSRLYGDLPKKNGDAACLLHCFKSLKEGGRMAVVVPEGALFRNDMQRIRKFLCEKSRLHSVISLPQGIFLPYTGVKTSILYFVEKEKSTTIKYWYFKVNNDGFTLNARRKTVLGPNDLDKICSITNKDFEERESLDDWNRVDFDTENPTLQQSAREEGIDTKKSSIILKEALEEITIKNHQNAPVWSVTNDKGFILAEEKFTNRVASDNTNRYKLVHSNFFAYNPARINVESIAFNSSLNVGCVSPMYVVFKICNNSLLNPQYLSWLFKSRNFQEKINNLAVGSVRQTVSFEKFCTISIPILSPNQQQKIIDELNSYQKIIAGAKQIIDNWKPFFELKSNWTIVSLKDIADINPPKNKIELAKDISVSFIPMEDIYPSEINVFPKQERMLGEAIKGYTCFFENDLLVAKITPCFENGKMAIARNLKNGIGFGSTEFILIRSNSNMVLVEWIYCCLRNLSFFIDGAAIMTGSVGHQRISADFVRNYKIPLPPLNIQQEIVDRLEQERRMIEYQKEIIKLFEEKIQTRINSLWKS